VGTNARTPQAEKSGWGGASAFMKNYECCICKKTVSSRQRSHELDPCGLVLIGNIDHPYSLQRNQDFYCHFECFRKLVNDDDIMYIMRPDDD
jgi:hypothetical protein